MTVKELKELLVNVPNDAEIMRHSDEYNGALSVVREVNYKPHGSWGVPANTLIIS